jgi:putative holliday junction resolvase
VDSARSNDRPIVALDVGQARVGIATWDSRRGVRDVAALRRTSLAEDVRRLTAIARERGVGLVLVGLPLNADGSGGPQARLTRRFATALAGSLREPKIAVEMADETDTSVEATAELGLAGRPLTDRERAAVDSRAAAILLRRYLEAPSFHAPSSVAPPRQE